MDAVSASKSSLKLSPSPVPSSSHGGIVTGSITGWGVGEAVAECIIVGRGVRVGESTVGVYVFIGDDTFGVVGVQADSKVASRTKTDSMRKGTFDE